ncbi:MAG TPA: biopolymer transporter ExbD, partial [Planctomycetaceae bacterium]|nr:biopolymer transporter ExbD [Planctomycetaceae bacterium]
IHFESVKSDERAKLPQHALARPPAASLNRQLLLNLGYGRSAVADRSQSDAVVTLAGSEIPLDRIRPELEREQSTTLRRAAADDVTVVIRADPEVPAGLVQGLIKTCQDVGFSRFSLKAIDAE